MAVILYGPEMDAVVVVQEESVFFLQDSPKQTMKEKKSSFFIQEGLKVKNGVSEPGIRAKLPFWDAGLKLNFALTSP